jgi:hypothetical protein
MIAKVVLPFHDVNGRKYLLIESNKIQYQVKVPFRYNRVLGCCVQGLKPVQDYEVGEYVEVQLERKLWEGDIFYILKSLKPVNTC